ncbi:hypothetical protein GGR51DRAFT_539090 [Nemania sp. FL0031]|nr:hypothetical protein GGR51DRAFT_539090 [Nemania sp. FL0031]
MALLERDQWDTGGTYIFGDGSDIHNIHPAVLAIKLGLIVAQNSVESLFRNSEPFDLTGPAYKDFPLSGIFSVLLGGSSTTGVATTIGFTGKWTQGKISEYMKAPIMLAETT